MIYNSQTRLRDNSQTIKAVEDNGCDDNPEESDMRYAETGYNLEIDLATGNIERVETDPKMTETSSGRSRYQRQDTLG